MTEHILSAYLLSGPGKGKSLASQPEIVAVLKAPELAWLHLQADHPGTAEWIESYLAFLTPIITTALVAEETRPRAAVIAEPDARLHARITETRRQVVAMRRHIGPQRDARDRLSHATIDLITEPDRLRLREAHDRLVRTVEDLDAMRDRLQVVKDEVANHQSERLNRNLYILSLVSAVFLPLGLLTGLMGINLGGLPGADHASAFWVFSGALAVIAVLLLALLRRMRMF